MSDKKQNELKWLNYAIAAKDNVDAEAKEILDMLGSPNLVDENVERPDFIKLVQPKNPGDRPTICGIEHFQANWLSKEKRNGDMSSLGVCIEKQRQQTRNDMYAKGNSLSKDEFFDKITKFGKQYATLWSETGYSSLIRSINHSLREHCERTEAYRQNIKILSNDQYDVKLAFLFEVHIDLSSLSFDGHMAMQTSQHKEVPLLDGIICALEQYIDCDQVDYIVLCLSDTLETDPPTIIALKSHDIREQLRRQHITSYVYAGTDIFQEEHAALMNECNITNMFDQMMNWVRIGKAPTDMDNFVQRWQSCDQQWEQLQYKTEQYILELEKRGVPYVTNLFAIQRNQMKDVALGQLEEMRRDIDERMRKEEIKRNGEDLS